MSDATQDVAGFLATIPLLDGLPADELEDLARVMRRREVRADAVLWRAGDEAIGMHLIVEGLVAITLPLPGERTVEVARLGPGQILGEIPLVDGGSHSAGVHALEPTQLLTLSRQDFAALVSRSHPTAFALKRRIAGAQCTRLRNQLATLADTLGGGPPPLAPAITELDPSGPPDPGYVRRLGTFRAFDALALWGFLTAGRYARCPAGSTLVAEGLPTDACYVTINGAVEKVLVRGGRRIRVGLAGPGQAFGYETLIDGRPAPLTATTRERTLLLALPRHQFERLFHGEEVGSHEFLDVVNRDLAAALRQALRPHAHLAVSV